MQLNSTARKNLSLAKRLRALSTVLRAKNRSLNSLFGPRSQNFTSEGRKFSKNALVKSLLRARFWKGARKSKNALVKEVTGYLSSWRWIMTIWEGNVRKIYESELILNLDWTGPLALVKKTLSQNHGEELRERERGTININLDYVRSSFPPSFGTLSNALRAKSMILRAVEFRLHDCTL